MSVEATRWVRDARPGDGKLEEGGIVIRVPEATRKVVLFVLAAHANLENRAWPSLATIAVESGLSPRTTKRAVASLLDDGWIGRLRQSGKSSMYVLALGRNPE